MAMNYIWELLIKAEKQGVTKKDVYFAHSPNYSPYMELSPLIINTKRIETDEPIEINPYYRYFEVFKNLFHPDSEMNEDIQGYLLDVVVHFLAEIDRMQGMNKREHYIRFLAREIEKDVFGQQMGKHFALFDQAEQELILFNILRLYRTGETLYLLRDILKKLFKKCFMYAKSEKRDEILLYVGQPKTTVTEQKLQFVQTIFLPIGFHLEIYWENHFGMIDVAETMQIDEIALY